MKVKPLNEKVKRTYQLQSYQDESLKMLSRKTRVKQVDFVREAVDDLILKYWQHLPKDLTGKVNQKLLKENSYYSL